MFCTYKCILCVSDSVCEERERERERKRGRERDREREREREGGRVIERQRVL